MTLIKKKITEVQSIVNKADKRKTAGRIYLPKDWIGKKVKTVLLSLLILMAFVVLMASPTAAIAKKHQPTQAVGTPSAGNDQPTSSPPTDDGSKAPTDDGTKAPSTSSDVIPISPSKVAVGNPLAAAPTPTTTPTPTAEQQFPLPPVPTDTIDVKSGLNGHPVKVIENNPIVPPKLVTLEDGSQQWQYKDNHNTLFGFINNKWVKITESSSTTPTPTPIPTIEDSSSSGSGSGSGSTSDGTSGSHGSHSNSGSEKYNGLTQIPSVTTDFPDNDKNAIEVHVTSANKDSIGSYHVRGEIKNLSKETTLQFVKVTAHLYDESGQPVAVTTCCYADPHDIEPGHTSTFDSFAQKDEISGTPTSIRLSFDWR